MKIRKTLNGLEPRTLRDSEQDPWDWFEEPDQQDMDPGDQLMLIVVIVTLLLALCGGI